MSVDRLGRMLAGGPDGRGLRKGQVQSFSVSADPDEGSTVTLLLDGAGDPIPGVGYLDSYAPTIGDWVWILTTPGLWLVVGKQA